MSEELKFDIAGGTSIRLLTAGKSCDKNIVVNAIGGSDTDAALESIWKVVAERRTMTTAVVPDSVTRIGFHAFASCTALSSVRLSANLIEISPYAFYCCYALRSISLPARLETIGTQAFDMTDLTSLIIPANVKTIGTKAFSSCKNLTSVTFKGKPESIASNAFSDCGNLTYMMVPWDRGEVAGAPWGATNPNLTIWYNNGSLGEEEL